MLKLSLSLTLAVAIAGGCAGAAISRAVTADTFQVVGELRGDSYVLDTHQTAEDCAAWINRERAAWGTDVQFSCVRER
jgi:hypothetical protein